MISICCVLASFPPKTFQVLTVAFYNVENLFDTFDDPQTLDDDRTPTGKDHWTQEHYIHKIGNLARVITAIGQSVTNTAPVLVGLAEVENLQVINDLIAHPLMRPYQYAVVHEDSPDRRGIDVALLYRTDYFRHIEHKAIELMLYEPQESKNPGRRIYTRDQLLVHGLLEGESMYCMINHWPSRRGGEKRSAYKRQAAAHCNKRMMDSIHAIDPYAKMISMGDFNDDPTSPSLKKIVKTHATVSKTPLQGFFNPMEKMHVKGYGTLAYGDQWNLFDQILLSKGFLDDQDQGYHFHEAGIHSASHLVTPQGKYKGYPFRSHASGSYTGGYSDHFPVYVYFIKPFQGIPRD